MRWTDNRSVSQSPVVSSAATPEDSISPREPSICSLYSSRTRMQCATDSLSVHTASASSVSPHMALVNTSSNGSPVVNGFRRRKKEVPVADDARLSIRFHFSWPRDLRVPASLMWRTRASAHSNIHDCILLWCRPFTCSELHWKDTIITWH